MSDSSKSSGISAVIVIQLIMLAIVTIVTVVIWRQYGTVKDNVLEYKAKVDDALALLLSLGIGNVKNYPD